MECYYLKRIQSSEKLIIPLKKKKIVIGRGKECTYQILDESISRNHVLIRSGNCGWTLKNLSTNGVYLNGKTVRSDVEMSLPIGSIIHLGNNEKFSFRFGMKSKYGKQICETKSLYQKNDSERKTADDASTKKLKNEMLAERLNTMAEENQEKLKLSILELERKLKREEDRKIALLKDKDELSVKLQIEKMNLERHLLQERKELQNQLCIEKEELQNQLLKLEEERIRFEQEAQHREKFLKLKEQEHEDIYRCRLKELENLKGEKEKLKERLIEVETNLEEKVLLTYTLEKELMEKEGVDKRLEALTEEKRILERNLRDAMEKGAQVSDLEESLKNLEAQKIALEQEVASVTSVSETSHKELLESFADVLENELQCPICNELFITAIMLNCSHTFCKFCIDSWKKNKKDCPNCRETIISETRSLVVDNFIDKIVSTLSEDMKQQRIQLIAERAADVTAARDSEVKVVATSSRRGRRRGGRQSRGGHRGNEASTRTVQQTAASTSSNYPQYVSNTVLSTENVAQTTGSRDANLLPDNPSSTDTDSSEDQNSLPSYDSDSSSESGTSHAYYGGYGRCFFCGRRGHWANGCPNR